MPQVAYLKKLCSENLPLIFAEAFAAHWRDSDRGNSAHIYDGEVRRFGKWVAERHGEFQPRSVTPLDMVEYRRWLQERGRAPATVNRILTTLRVFFAWLEKTGQAKDKQAREIKSVAVNEKLAPKPPNDSLDFPPSTQLWQPAEHAKDTESTGSGTPVKSPPSCHRRGNRAGGSIP